MLCKRLDMLLFVGGIVDMMTYIIKGRFRVMVFGDHPGCPYGLDHIISVRSGVGSIGGFTKLTC